MNNRKIAFISQVLSTVFLIVPIGNATSLSSQNNIAQASGTIAQCDTNGDSQVSILDVVAIINKVLAGGEMSTGTDCNEDGTVNIQDIVASINLLLNANPNEPLTFDCTKDIVVPDISAYIKDNQYFLSLRKGLGQSTMSYCSGDSAKNGAAFELKYVDTGGSGMDSYPNGGVGGIKTGGTWYPGDKSLTGVPVQLAELDESLSIQWKVSQENARDDEDKWMASINMIFDEGEAESDPVKEDRDFDLVIELSSHNFNNSTEDVTEGSKRNYFARNKDDSLRPFTVTVAGKDYHFAVRYKFYYNSGDKDNKVHVKYIPMGEENVPPYLNHTIKSFIDNSKAFIKYANMPDVERDLAEQKVAKSTLYLKSIRAGYEVYRGQSTLRNDYFRLIKGVGI